MVSADAVYLLYSIAVQGLWMGWNKLDKEKQKHQLLPEWKKNKWRCSTEWISRDKLNLEHYFGFGMK